MKGVSGQSSPFLGYEDIYKEQKRKGNSTFEEFYERRSQSIDPQDDRRGLEYKTGIIPVSRPLSFRSSRLSSLYEMTGLKRLSLKVYRSSSESESNIPDSVDRKSTKKLSTRISKGYPSLEEHGNYLEYG